MMTSPAAPTAAAVRLAIHAQRCRGRLGTEGPLVGGHRDAVGMGWATRTPVDDGVVLKSTAVPFVHGVIGGGVVAQGRSELQSDRPAFSRRSVEPDHGLYAGRRARRDVRRRTGNRRRATGTGGLAVSGTPPL